MGSGSYNINKAAIRSFFERRLRDTFGKSVSLSFTKIAGNDENPRFGMLVDNASLANDRRDGGSVPKGSPLPIGLSFVMQTDGNGGGEIVVSFLKDHLGGNRSYSNTNSNLRKWGWGKLPEDNNVPNLKYTSRIVDYDVEGAIIKSLTDVRKIVRSLASFRQSS